MIDKDFKKYNLIIGWAVFAIALITYSLTVEPTVSFWDCGEYIATSAKLEVGHPPGAPFFQMMGAFIAAFAPNPDKIALLVNYMSVLSSAFTVLFLYFIIVNLTKKIAIRGNDNLSLWQTIAVMGSGAIGALAYTFSDSFWFNAVEAEVYAMAMLFMSAMFWLGIKWTDSLHEPRGDRWLLLIALVVGLSFGVHFMALLTIPAIGMLYFFNSNYKKNLRNFIIANVVSIAILLLIFKLILPYTLAYFGYLEVFFVNTFHMPFNSGTIIAGLSVVAFFYFSLKYSHKKQKVKLQTAILCLLFIFIGFSSWLMIPIRANANTVINENSPTDARLLLAYYNLEQYPETHLFYGPMYTDKYAGIDPEHPYEDAKPKYERDYNLGKYVIVNPYKNAQTASNSAQMGFLPRMWSPQHAVNYMKLTGLPPFKVAQEAYSDSNTSNLLLNIQQQMTIQPMAPERYDQFLTQFRDEVEVQKPTFWQNMNYLFSYQFGYMYFRYFAWNFIGRQDDVQGKLENDHGNWLSGINAIDSARLGSQKNLPQDVLNNKAHNTYYFLPLLLGLLGLVFMSVKSERQTWVVLVLFLFTGLALKIYLNERPFEPRERDYALVGSFYAFAIWIGMGVYALFSIINKYLKEKISAPIAVLTSLIAVPVLMASENWDDHDRSEKYSAEFIANAYLSSVAKDKDAMIFTIGDNDTFLLWYAQEIEGYRTDVRVINTSLLQTDWYIDQMKRKAYQSNPIPAQIEHKNYAYGVREGIYFRKRTENRWNIKDFVNWITSDDPNTQETRGEGEYKQTFYYYPTNKIRIPVNKENVLKSGIVKPEDADKIVDYIDITLPNAIDKARIVMLDILANNDWKRPIYFTGGSMDATEYIWMKDYLQLDGLVYKLVPIKTAIDKNHPFDMGRIDSDLMYNIVKQWDWGNMGKKNIYLDPETRKNSIIFRGNIARLVEQLISEGKKQKAKEMLDIAMKNMPVEAYGYYFTLDPFVQGYFKIGEKQTAQQLALQLFKKYQEELNYYAHLNAEELNLSVARIQYAIDRYGDLLSSLEPLDAEFYKKEWEVFKAKASLFMGAKELEEYFKQEETVPSMSTPDSLIEEE
nr:DUF2723 domain-containing protein [uncultured Capnocytophaga sp.]